MGVQGSGSRMQAGFRGMWIVTVEQQAKPTGQTVHSVYELEVQGSGPRVQGGFMVFGVWRMMYDV